MEAPRNVCMHSGMFFSSIFGTAQSNIEFPCREGGRGVTFAITLCGIITVGLTISLVMIAKETNINMVYVKNNWKL